MEVKKGDHIYAMVGSVDNPWCDPKLCEADVVRCYKCHYLLRINGTECKKRIVKLLTFKEYLAASSKELFRKRTWALTSQKCEAFEELVDAVLAHVPVKIRTLQALLQEAQEFKDGAEGTKSPTATIQVPASDKKVENNA